LIHNPKKDLKKTLELCKQVYDAAYFMKNLPLKIRHLVEHQTQAKSIMLNGPNNKNKHSKTLFLDLDETLIHTSFTTSEGFNQ
jgi:predicted secreted acid phosphatase